MEAVKVETVTVQCWKCRGSGRYALGVCFECNGYGTCTYNAAAYARKMSAAAGRRETEQRRNAAAAAAVDERLARMSLDELAAWVRDVATVGHDGLVEDWRPGSDTETERVTVETKARRLHEQLREGLEG